VRAAVRGALACLARSPDKDGISLTVDIPEGCRALIKSVALQHVLLNIMLNARNAMMPGGGRLALKPSSATRFFSPELDVRIDFDGSGETVTVYVNGDRIDGTRVR